VVMLFMRAIEVGASALIAAFGGLLLAGYLASEQLWMFSSNGELSTLEPFTGGPGACG